MIESLFFLYYYYYRHHHHNAINLLNPTGHVMHQQHSTTVRSAHIVFVCFVFIWEQTDLCHLQHKLIGFYNREEKCLLRGTNWVFK